MQEELPPRVPVDVDVRPALELLSHLGWHVEEQSPALRQLAVSMQAAERVGLPLTPDRLAAYAEAAQIVATQEVEGIPRSSVADALTYVVVGTVLSEPILLALRRLAHQDASARLFGT
ncbi:MAG: hypothetical protein ACLGIA_04180 [Actinomycetes bacterium]